MSWRSWLSFEHTTPVTPNIQDGQQAAAHSSPRDATKTNPQPQQIRIAAKNNVSFDDIADRFIDLTNEVNKLQQIVSTQASQLSSQERVHTEQLETLRRSFTTEINAKAVLQQAIVGGKQLVQLRRQGPTEPFVQFLNAQRKRHRDELNHLQEAREKGNRSYAALRKEVDHLRTEHATLAKEYLTVKNTCAELKFELEYTKCITPSFYGPAQGQKLTSLSTPLPHVPFVVVLVDGDAYSFRSALPSEFDGETETHPARRISASIKNYLRTYLIEHQLPAHCKLFVRILKNWSRIKGYHRANSVKRRAKNITVTEDFMLEFTESSPLFDFVDVGTGKERVDSKIHELYHLFIPNPSCFKIFIAATTDNGFARLFEQYIDHPTARAKTCLISAGLIEDEIKHLNIETVEWPDVFGMRIPKNPGSQYKLQAGQQCSQEEATNKEYERIKVTLQKKLGEAGYEKHLRDLGIARFTRELHGWRGATDFVYEMLEARNWGIRSQDRLISSLSDQLRRSSTCLEEGVD